MLRPLVFTGNPGTGKTMVARLVAKIYRALDLLSSGHLIETDRSGLVAGYVGQTAIKTKEVISRAKGGVLFIDEAYTLSSSNSENDYGREAIETLLKAMEDYRDDFAVIAAGYPDEMERFLSINPGLQSRFNRFIKFDDYNNEELYRIFVQMCTESGYTYEDSCAHALIEVIDRLSKARVKGFGNARFIRNLFEEVVSNHANRISSISNPSHEEIQTFEVEDIPQVD